MKSTRVDLNSIITPVNMSIYRPTSIKSTTLHSHGNLEAQNAILRQANAELQASYDHYLSLYEFAPVGYLTLNTNGTIVQANLFGAAMLNYDRQQLIGSQFDSLVALEYKKFWSQQFALVMRHDMKLNCSLSLKRNKSDYCHVRLEFLRIIKAEITQEIRIIITDITTHRHEEERLRLALDGSKLGFWEVDLETGVSMIDIRYAETFGYPPSAEIFGSPPLLKTNRDWWIKTIYPADLKQTLEIGRKYKNGEIDTYEVEYRVSRPDGKIVWILSKGVAVARRKDGSPLRMVGTAQDITERKNAEESLQRKKTISCATRISTRSHGGS
jgi:PAS domain S-box-containing protein